MKRTVSLFLFLLLAFQAGGLLFIYSFQQQFIRQRMLKALEGNDERIEKLVLTKEVYRAAKVNHFEICMEGKMYDVKSVSMQDDTVELLAIHDKDEENILEEIRKLICHSSDKKLPYSNLLSGLSTLTYEKAGCFFTVPSFVKENRLSVQLRTVRPVSLSLPVICPPPEA